MSTIETASAVFFNKKKIDEFFSSNKWTLLRCVWNFFFGWRKKSEPSFFLLFCIVDVKLKVNIFNQFFPDRLRKIKLKVQQILQVVLWIFVYLVIISGIGSSSTLRTDDGWLLGLWIKMYSFFFAFFYSPAFVRRLFYFSKIFYCQWWWQWWWINEEKMMVKIINLKKLAMFSWATTGTS